MNSSRSPGVSLSTALGTSENEALKPIIEWFSTTTYSLEEQRYALKRQIANQKPRHGFLAVGREGTLGFLSRHIPDPLHIPQAESILISQLAQASPWIPRSDEVVRLTLETDAPREPDDFFEEP